MKKIPLSACVLIVLALCVSCTQKLREVTFVPQIKEYTMLIAGDSSEFKDSVRDKLIEKYRATCEIQVINISELKGVDSDLYDVVVIMDTCMAWSEFNPSLKAFLDNEKNRSKTVLSMTAGNPDWKFTYKDVDAITSASRAVNREFFFYQIDEGIQKVLNTDRI